MICLLACLIDQMTEQRMERLGIKEGSGFEEDGTATPSTRDPSPCPSPHRGRHEREQQQQQMHKNGPLCTSCRR